MKRLMIATLALTGWLVPAELSAQVSWPMFQANAAHTGYLPVSFDPNDFTLDWEVTLSPNGQDVNAVTAVGGRVFASLDIYFQNGQDDFFTLDATDGTILWSKDFGDVFSVNPPAYDGGLVYLQVGNHGSDTHLYTFDAASGVMINDGNHSAQWESYYAPTIVGGTAYINGGYYGGMYSFNFSEVPSQRWFKPLNQYDEWTPAVDGVFAYAYTGSYSPNLSVVRCWDGFEEFSIPDPNFDWNGWSMDLAPVLGGQNDVLVVQDGRLISFDIGARDIRYELTDGFGRAIHNSTSGQPSVAKGVVYVINNGNLEARNQSDGAFLWTWTPVGDIEVVGTMIITNAHALITTVDYSSCEGSAIHAIDLTTHQSVWSYAIPGTGEYSCRVVGNLAWSEGRMYFSRTDGVLTALKLLNPYEQSSVVQFESTSYSAGEADGTASVKLRRSGSGEGTVGVTITSANGTATAGSDFTAIDQVVTWIDGDTEDKTVQVVILNDSDVEGLESLSFSLHTVTGPTTLGVLSRAVLNILDDETDVIRFSSSNSDVGETAGSLSVYVLRDGPATGEVSVHFETGGGSATPGSDYTATSGTLSWDPGDKAPQQIPVSILDDQYSEENEFFTLALSEPEGAVIVGSPAIFTVSVIDDDGPRLQFTSASYQAAETGGTVDLTVKRLGGAEGAVSVSWATSNGTATAGSDYVADSGSFDWGDGDDSDRIITITILDDADTEGGETFEVTLSDLVGDTAFGQPFKATVAIADDEAAEFLVPTETDLGQTRPRVAMNAIGSAVAVWDSWKEDGWGWGVFGQRLDGDGNPVGDAFQINQATDENQMDAAVAVTSDGSFVVVWESAPDSVPRILGRRFNAAGAPLGDEFMVNSSTSGTQSDPRVAFDGNGDFMVVWTGRDASSFGAFGRVFANDGTPAGDEVALNTLTFLAQHSPAVTGLPGGGFVTVWESYGQEDFDSDGVFAQRFSSAGAPVGGEFPVNTTTEDDQCAPSVVAAGSGAFLVVWEDGGSLDGAFGSIQGQWFDASGNPVNGEFQINSYAAGDQGRPSADADSLGRVAVVWEGRSNQDGSEIGVYGRTLFDDGTFATGEVQFNTYVSNSQDEPDVACSSAGTLLAVWSSEQQDGSGEGVYGVSWPLPPAPMIFTDGFESSDMTVWSASVP